MALRKVSLEENVFNLQKCYLSSKLFKSVNQVGSPKSYAFLHNSPKCQRICRLVWEKDLHPTFTRIDNSVVVYKECQQNDEGMPCEPINQPYDVLKISDIKVIPSINNIKSLVVSFVFEDVKSIKKWKDNINSLLSIAKSVLQLYVISDCCVVYLKNLQEHQRLGIYCLVIHRIITFGSGDSLIGRVTSSTKLGVNRLLSRSRFKQRQVVHNTFELGGLGGPYQALKEIIESQSARARGKCLQTCHQVLLIGPPGCGKTSLVHKIAIDCDAVLINIVGPEVCHPKPGDTETALRYLFQEAADMSEEGLTILLLDEIDSICLKKDKGVSSHSARATSQLLNLLEKIDDFHQLVVVATTNRPFDLDPAVRRPGRLETEIYIGVPTEQQRREILYILARPMLSPDFEHTEELCKKIAQLTPGYVGADLSFLCQDVAFLRFRNHESTRKSNLKNWLEVFRVAIGRMRPASLRSGIGVVTTHPTSLSEIGGLDEIKRTLRTAVEWPLLHPDAFARLGLAQPHGVLLYGPPGCAKTRLALALATETNTTFLATSAAELYSPYVGDAEKGVMELFHRARLGAPTILFIDEIDALVGSRGDREKGVRERILSTFLTEMDGIGIGLEGALTIQSHPQLNNEKKGVVSGIIVIAATNRPDMLDDALMRPGRFDKHIYVPPPDTFSRFSIFQICLAQTPLSSSVDLSALALATECFSGADIKSLCREAALHALAEGGMQAKELTRADFSWSLEQIRPSLSKNQIQWYKNYSLSHKRL